MEIHTQNLLSVSIDGNKLTSNFIMIDKTLKHVQQQLDQLFKNQGIFTSSVDYQNKQIVEISKKIRAHDQTLKVQNSLLQQFGFEDERSDKMKTDNKLQQFPSNLKLSKNSSVKQLDNQSMRSSRKLNQQRTSITPKQQVTRQNIYGNKAKPKSGADKFMTNFKDRLLALEKQNDEKRIIIADLQEYVDKMKAKLGGKKSAQNLLKKSIAKKTYEEKPRPSLIIPEAQVKLDSAKSIPRSVINEGGQSSESINWDALAKNDQITLEMEGLKVLLIEKIKSIEAQFKQSQHRAQNIEKTMDLLERNHEMLKYDFDRTSTSWSKNRPFISQDKFRSQDKLTDTRMTNKQLYEDKLMELFNDMEVIKKEYVEISAKLSREQDDFVINNNLTHVSPEGKGRASRLVHTLKNEGSQNQKDIVVLKRELTKLRSQFEDFAFGVNTNVGEVKTVVIKPNETKQDWKILSTKIYKLKMEMQSGLREMQTKIATNNDMVVVLNSLETGIEECRLLLKRKVQHADYEKGLKRIEVRLNNFIAQVYEKQNRQNEADVSLAKQPWFCLSCDSQLKNYASKISKSPPKEKLAGRKVNPESHMVRRNQNGRFPSVLK